jgi:hypothetical protein
VKAPKSFARISTPAAARRLNLARTQAALARKQTGLVNHPPPPQTMAMILDSLRQLWLKMQIAYACELDQKALDQIDDVLTRYGKNLSKKDYDELNQAGEDLWEQMVNLGC